MIDYVTNRLDRESAEQILSRHRGVLLPVELVQSYEIFREKEIKHINHVRMCMNVINSDTAVSLHDHSKTEFYFFITVCAFSMKDHCVVDGELLKEIIREHHQAETHHPEFEIYNPDKEICWLDILEMAVDRLSRNLQANEGQFNADQIRRYEPNFVKHHDVRIALYRTLVPHLKPLVKDRWLQIFAADSLDGADNFVDTA